MSSYQSSRGGKASKPFGPRRKRTCPFSGPGALTIDYKNERMLRQYMTETGKIASSRNTGVCAKKQRELTIAIKRARHLAILPFVAS